MFFLREPTFLKRRKAASRRRNGLACAIPPGSESRTRSHGFPRNLGGPAVSTVNAGWRYRLTNSRPVVGALDGHGSETRVQPWYCPREGNEARREGRQGVGAPHTTDDAGEPTRGTPSREGGAGP